MDGESITSVRLASHTCKNYNRADHAQEAVYCLIACRKYGVAVEQNILRVLPMDVAKIIAKVLWETRFQKEWIRDGCVICKHAEHVQ